MSIFPVSPTHESLSQVREWALHLQSGLKETQSKDVMPEGKEAPPALAPGTLPHLVGG